MFGKKKKPVEHIKTFQDGVEVPQNVPDLEIPVYPEQQEPMQQPQYECPVCFDFGFYADNVGVWHHCLRCNPQILKDNGQGKKPIVPEKPKLQAPYVYRVCEHCGKDNEVHNRKKAFICKHCKQDSEVTK